MKKWELKYEKDEIVVENYFNKESLYVNGELQDEQMGCWSSRSRLFGRLPHGKEVKVSLGGSLSVHCRIFIDNELLLSE